MNHSTPRPKGQGLLEVTLSGAYYPVLKDGDSRRRTGEIQQGSGTSVLLVLKVRPEAFPNGSPMSVW